MFFTFVFYFILFQSVYLGRYNTLKHRLQVGLGHFIQYVIHIQRLKIAYHTPDTVCRFFTYFTWFTNTITLFLFEYLSCFGFTLDVFW